MLQQILLTSVAVPFIMGLVIAFSRQLAPTRSLLLIAFLVPIAAAIAQMSIEGFPPLPPVSARQKLPVVLVVAGIAFAVLAAVLPKALSKASAAILSLVAFVPALWWLGKNVLAANASKATVVGILFVIAALSLIVASSRKTERPTGASVAYPASLLAVSIASAIAAVSGGYIGMAQMNGALASLTGAWLLVAYVRYLRGDDTAFTLDGFAAFSFGWTAAIGLFVTALLAPSANPAALILAILPLPLGLFVERMHSGFPGMARSLRPVLIGLICAIPAILAIIIAILFAEG